MEAKSYDTQQVATKDRFAYWREAVCDSYVRLGCEAGDREGFEGRIEIARHSVLSISRVSGKAHVAERRKTDIQASTECDFILSLQTGQSSRVSQYGQSCELQPGDMALYASTDPYRLDLTLDFSQIVVQLPQAQLLERLPHAQMMTARKLSGQSQIGMLVGHNIQALADQIQKSDPLVQSLAQTSMIDLIATGFASLESGRLELSSPERQTFLRAQSFIGDHLGDPDLDRQEVANAVGLSVRRLNDILAEEGTSLSRLIRDMRLKRVAQALQQPALAHQSISEIAFRHGFSNMQNFSTLFRTHFGISPRGYRAQS